MDAINQVSQTVDGQLQRALANPFLMAVLKIMIALYAAQVAPRLPGKITDLFQTTLVKVIALFLIIYISERDFQLAVMLSVLFVLGTNFVAGRGIFESFSDFSNVFTSSTSAKLIEPMSAIYPGCQKLTIADVEKVFDGDNIKMQTTVMQTYHELLQKVKGKPAKESLMKIAHAIGLPHNIKFNDESAPYIATLLMYHGFMITESCRAPQ
jgi:hypothetical protein